MPSVTDTYLLGTSASLPIVSHYRGQNIRRIGLSDSASKLRAEEVSWFRSMLNLKRGYTVEVLHEYDPYNYHGVHA